MIRLKAPLACPECGAKVTGEWDAEIKTSDQACRCGHVFAATWPGFPFKPLTVTAPDLAAARAVARAIAVSADARSVSHAPSHENPQVKARFSGQSGTEGGAID